MQRRGTLSDLRRQASVVGDERFSHPLSNPDVVRKGLDEYSASNRSSRSLPPRFIQSALDQDVFSSL